MNREIKFRGKRIENDEWIYSSSVIIKKVAGVDNVLLNEGGKWLRIFPETVGQYTGLKDKDGNEIYEGDKYRCMIHNVIGGGWDLFEGIVKPLSPHENSIPTTYTQFTVIGNIHDTPELLTNTQSNDIK